MDAIFHFDGLTSQALVLHKAQNFSIKSSRQAITDTENTSDFSLPSVQLEQRVIFLAFAEHLFLHT